MDGDRLRDALTPAVRRELRAMVGGGEWAPLCDWLAESGLAEDLFDVVRLYGPDPVLGLTYGDLVEPGAFVEAVLARPDWPYARDETGRLVMEGRLLDHPACRAAAAAVRGHPEVMPPGLAERVLAFFLRRDGHAEVAEAVEAAGRLTSVGLARPEAWSEGELPQAWQLVGGLPDPGRRVVGACVCRAGDFAAVHVGGTELFSPGGGVVVEMSPYHSRSPFGWPRSTVWAGICHSCRRVLWAADPSCPLSWRDTRRVVLALPFFREMVFRRYASVGKYLAEAGLEYAHVVRGVLQKHGFVLALPLRDHPFSGGGRVYAQDLRPWDWLPPRHDGVGPGDGMVRYEDSLWRRARWPDQTPEAYYAGGSDFAGGANAAVLDLVRQSLVVPPDLLSAGTGTTYASTAASLRQLEERIYGTSSLRPGYATWHEIREAQRAYDNLLGSVGVPTASWDNPAPNIVENLREIYEREVGQPPEGPRE